MLLSSLGFLGGPGFVWVRSGSGRAFHCLGRVLARRKNSQPALAHCKAWGKGTRQLLKRGIEKTGAICRYIYFKRAANPQSNNRVRYHTRGLPSHTISSGTSPTTSPHRSSRSTGTYCENLTTPLRKFPRAQKTRLGKERWLILHSLIVASRNWGPLLS